MKVYNTLTKKIDEFTADRKKLVMYVCGLTPYDHAHIGHTRTYIAFDVIKRYLLSQGYNVFHIQNITDVDDKILKRCRETAADPKELTERLHKEALELFDKLGILRADVYPKVSEHINEIIMLINRLLEIGLAYETPSGIYFDVMKFRGYGKLSGQKLEDMKAGARVEIDESKANPMDFALWKKTKGDLLEWPSPWGVGRPGWHIECSAMAKKYGGETIDIHGGARDLIFPHHENEIAQSEGANDKQFCRYWMHTGFLTVNGEKMSKSLGNFVTLKDALVKFDPNAIRLFFLQTHYRSPIDYNEDNITAANEAVEYILNSYGLVKERLKEQGKGTAAGADAAKKIQTEIAKFYVSMDDDFDTPNALASLFNLLRIANARMKDMENDDVETLAKELEKILLILGIVERKSDLESKKTAITKLLEDVAADSNAKSKSLSKKKETAEDMLEQIIAIREDARKKKDFLVSDQIRTRLKEIGIILEDKEGKVRWKES